MKYLASLKPEVIAMYYASLVERATFVSFYVDMQQDCHTAVVVHQKLTYHRFDHYPSLSLYRAQELVLSHFECGQYSVCCTCCVA